MTRFFFHKDSEIPVIMVSNQSILEHIRQSTGEMTVTTGDAATRSQLTVEL